MSEKFREGPVRGENGGKPGIAKDGSSKGPSATLGKRPPPPPPPKPKR